MEQDNIPVQCYKCKKIKDENDLWQFHEGKAEHIEFANHTICPDCIEKTHSEMQVKYIFNEFASRINNIFKNLKVFCFSNNNSLKNMIISNFSKTGIKVDLFEMKDFANKNIAADDNQLSVFIADIENETELNQTFEKLKNRGIIIFIIEKKHINYYLKFIDTGNTDYLFKDFFPEEIICKIYLLLSRKTEKKMLNSEIKSLKTKKIELLNQLMLFQDSESAAALDVLKESNDKLKTKLEELKKIVSSKNLQIMDLSEKIEESEMFDKTTRFKNFYGLYDFLSKESKKMMKSGYKCVIAEINFKVLTDLSEPVLYSSAPEDYFMGYEEYLKNASDIIKKNVGKNDFAVRISFNKTILFMIDKNMESAIPVIEKIETEINNCTESGFSSVITLFELDNNSRLENIFLILDNSLEAE